MKTVICSRSMRDSFIFFLLSFLAFFPSRNVIPKKTVVVEVETTESKSVSWKDNSTKMDNKTDH